MNHRPARVLAVVIHAADVDQVIEAEILLGDSTDLGDLLRIGSVRVISPRNSVGAEIRLPNRAAIFAARSRAVICRQGFLKLAVRDQTARFWWAITGSLAILFCILIKASSRASGRGGQPAT